MIKPEFTEQELGALMALIDAGIKASGLAGMPATNLVLPKIEAAMAEFKRQQLLPVDIQPAP